MGESGAAAGSERQRPVTLRRSRGLYGLGASMFAALAVCSRRPNGTAAPSFLVPLAVAGVPYRIMGLHYKIKELETKMGCYSVSILFANGTNQPGFE